MTTTQHLRRTGLRTLAAAAACLLLTAAAPAATAAATAPHTTAMRAGTAITCQELDTDLPSVFGRDCNANAWGPIADFTITDAGSGATYSCRDGWAEGSAWVRGNDCAPAN